MQTDFHWCPWWFILLLYRDFYILVQFSLSTFLEDKFRHRHSFNMKHVSAAKKILHKISYTRYLCRNGWEQPCVSSGQHSPQWPSGWQCKRGCDALVSAFPPLLCHLVIVARACSCADRASLKMFMFFYSSSASEVTWLQWPCCSCRTGAVRELGWAGRPAFVALLW